MASLTPAIESPSVWVGDLHTRLKARGRNRHWSWGEDLSRCVRWSLWSKGLHSLRWEWRSLR
eukprot:3231157-Pleurochrysis_carterae.AAC.1